MLPVRVRSTQLEAKLRKALQASAAARRDGLGIMVGAVLRNIQETTGEGSADTNANENAWAQAGTPRGWDRSPCRDASERRPVDQVTFEPSRTTVPLIQDPRSRRKLLRRKPVRPRLETRSRWSGRSKRSGRSLPPLLICDTCVRGYVAGIASLPPRPPLSEARACA
jgi:hypothetical protein